MAIFVTVVEQGNFSKAAKNLVSHLQQLAVKLVG
jgi:DNA-binding transcriptional LysR family regulator